MTLGSSLNVNAEAELDSFTHLFFSLVNPIFLLCNQHHHEDLMMHYDMMRSPYYTILKCHVLLFWLQISHFSFLESSSQPSSTIVQCLPDVSSRYCTVVVTVLLIGMSLLCSKFYLLFFQEFPKKCPIILFFFLILIPSLLFHNNAQHEIM